MSTWTDLAMIAASAAVAVGYGFVVIWITGRLERGA